MQHALNRKLLDEPSPSNKGSVSPARANSGLGPSPGSVLLLALGFGLREGPRAKTVVMSQDSGLLHFLRWSSHGSALLLALDSLQDKAEMIAWNSADHFMAYV